MKRSITVLACSSVSDELELFQTAVSSTSSLSSLSMYRTCTFVVSDSSLASSDERKGLTRKSKTRRNRFALTKSQLVSLASCCPAYRYTILRGSLSYLTESDMGLESIWIFASLTLKSIMASRMVLSLLATGAQRLVSDPVEKKPLPTWSPAQATSESSTGGFQRATLLPTLNYAYQPTSHVLPITAPLRAATSGTTSVGASLSSSAGTGETSSWTSASPNPASTMTGLTSIGSQGGGVGKEEAASSEVLLVEVARSESSLEEGSEKEGAEK